MLKNNTLKSNTLKSNTLQIFINLAKKYRVQHKGRTKKQIADSLSGLRGSYLSNNVNKRILLQNYNNTRKKLPK